MQKYNLKLYIAFKIVFVVVSAKGGNLYFRDFLQK